MGFDLNCQPGGFDVLWGYGRQLSLPLPFCTQNHFLPPFPHYRFTPMAAICDS